MQEGKGKGSFAALTVPLPTSPKCRAILPMLSNVIRRVSVEGAEGSSSLPSQP